MKWRPHNPRSTQAHTRQRGYLILDMVIGMSVVGICLTVLVGASVRLQHNDRRLADVRQAERDLEAAAVVLDARDPGVPAKQALPEPITLQWLDTSAPSGFRWARLSINHAAGQQTLVTLTRHGDGGHP